MIFLFLADDFSGPSNSKEGFWLASAVALANLKLKNPEADNDHLFRRAYLALVTLDRWHSAAVSVPMLIAEDDIHLTESDHAIIGSSSYYILSKSSSHLIVHDLRLTFFP